MMIAGPYEVCYSVFLNRRTDMCKRPTIMGNKFAYTVPVREREKHFLDHLLIAQGYVFVSQEQFDKYLLLL